MLVYRCDKCCGRYQLSKAYLELASRITAAVLARGREILPEERVVDVAASVEVEQGGNLGGCCGVTLALGLGDRLEGAVETVDVGLVVLLVVQLHDLAGDVGFEGAIVV